jgi:hypothetical protein
MPAPAYSAAASTYGIRAQANHPRRPGALARSLAAYLVIAAASGGVVAAVEATGATPIVTVFAGSTVDAKRTATLELTGGGPDCRLESVRFDAPAAASPAGVTFPDGLIDFVASHCNRGSTLRLTLITSTLLPPAASYWIYGPTLADRSPHWYPLSATVSGNTIAYRITDGAVGDSDLVANGMVTGLGGIGIGVVAPPAVPEGLAALPGNGSVSLRWDAVSSAFGYTIKRATTKEGPLTTVSVRQPGNVFTDNDRANGTTYYYAVNAVNSGGESADSARVQVTPVAAKKITACGVEPMTAPRTIACPPEMAGSIIEEEVYACRGTQWQSTGWRVKESMCTTLDLGSAPATTF